jgi:hypothetical protein
VRPGFFPCVGIAGREHDEESNGKTRSLETGTAHGRSLARVLRPPVAISQLSGTRGSRVK